MPQNKRVKKNIPIYVTGLKVLFAIPLIEQFVFVMNWFTLDCFSIPFCAQDSCLSFYSLFSSLLSFISINPISFYVVLGEIYLSCQYYLLRNHSQVKFKYRSKLSKLSHIFKFVLPSPHLLYHMYIGRKEIQYFNL